MYTTPRLDIRSEAGEMTHGLKALSVFSEDPGLVPSIHISSSQLPVTPGDLMPSSGFVDTWTHMIHIHTLRQIHIHIKSDYGSLNLLVLRQGLTIYACLT